MAATAGEVQVKIRANDAGLKAGLNNAKTQVDGAAKSMGRSMASLKGMLGGIVAGIGIARATRFIIDATVEQEDAINSLQTALAQQGRLSKDAQKDLEDYASAIQKVTVYGDEEILQQMALAMNMGVSSGRIKEVTKASIGLATAARVDVKTAMGLMVRAMNGNTATLSKYGFALDQTKSKAEQFEELLKMGTAAFSLAENKAKGAKGQIQQFKNAVGDLAEKIGMVLYPIVVRIVGLLNIFVTWMNNGGAATVKLITGIAATVAAFLVMYKAIAGVIAISKVLAEWNPYWAAAMGAAALAIGIAWSITSQQINKGMADIENAAAAMGRTTAGAGLGDLGFGNAMDDVKGLGAEVEKVLKPTVDDAAKKAAEDYEDAVLDLVKANREEAKSEREKQRAMVGWTGLADLWKGAMAAGQKERFGAKGYGRLDLTRKDLARRSGEENAFAFQSEFQRAENEVTAKDANERYLKRQYESIKAKRASYGRSEAPKAPEMNQIKATNKAATEQARRDAGRDKLLKEIKVALAGGTRLQVSQGALA